MNRTEALSLMHDYTSNESLRRHMYCVEQALRAYAKHFNTDVDLWGITGLLHDFDYERYPNAPDHPIQGSHILKQHGYPDEMIVAILGHAEYTNVPRTTLLAKTLFACDELCGFLVACALVKPDKSISTVEFTTVKKKLKDKAFARNVSREDILNGAKELDVDLEWHISFVINALRTHAHELGL